MASDDDPEQVLSVELDLRESYTLHPTIQAMVGYVQREDAWRCLMGDLRPFLVYARATNVRDALAVVVGWLSLVFRHYRYQSGGTPHVSDAFLTPHRFLGTGLMALQRKPIEWRAFSDPWLPMPGEDACPHPGCGLAVGHGDHHPPPEPALKTMKEIGDAYRKITGTDVSDATVRRRLIALGLLATGRQGRRLTLTRSDLERKVRSGKP